MPQGKVHTQKYLIEIPIPYVDKHGVMLSKSKGRDGDASSEKLLTECFGGFTPGKAPALKRVPTAEGKWITLAEKGQVVLRSACRNRAAFCGIETVLWISSFRWAKTWIRLTYSSWPTDWTLC